MTGLLDPKSSKIVGISFFMVIVAYLGAMGFFVRSSSLFFASESILRRCLKAPNLSKTPEKQVVYTSSIVERGPFQIPLSNLTGWVGSCQEVF